MSERWASGERETRPEKGAAGNAQGPGFPMREGSSPSSPIELRLCCGGVGGEHTSLSRMEIAGSIPVRSISTFDHSFE